MKTILACLRAETDTREILQIALPLAERHDSHLIGFHVQERVAFYPGASVHVPTEIYIDFQKSQEQDSAATKAVFDDMTRTTTCQTEWRTMTAASPDTPSLLVQSAYTADLVVMAQADYSVDKSSIYYVQESVIRGSGRPVLFVPSELSVNAAIGRKVVIGWSPTREAARAAHDALPLLQDGAEVIVATVSKSATDSFDGATELALMFDRHGFRSEVVHRTVPAPNIAEELCKLAFENGADMIVTGAFGHSRFYDFVIGAVTLDLMRQARLPVLFSK